MLLRAAYPCRAGYGLALRKTQASSDEYYMKHYIKVVAIVVPTAMACLIYLFGWSAFWVSLAVVFCWIAIVIAMTVLHERNNLRIGGVRRNDPPSADRPAEATTALKTTMPVGEPSVSSIANMGQR
jgi:uncharacterized membrane protein